MSLKNTSHWINQKEIQAHLVELKKYPPLTREQEIILLNQVKNGDHSKKEVLILSNLRFVVTVAKKYQNQGLALNDLISEGNYGLVTAAERYDYDKQPVRFLSYAVWWIKQSIIKSLHENSRTVRIPTNVIIESCKSGNQPLQDTMHDYTLQLPRVLSFDISVDEESNSLHEIIKDENAKSPDNELDNAASNVQGALKKILSLLKHNEQEVVIKLFGLGGTEPWTLQDIADNMELTKERVRQIKEKALKKLREKSFLLVELLDK